MREAEFSPGKGVATEAVRLLISQARSNLDVCYVHAYPTIANAASNALALGQRFLGFAGSLDAAQRGDILLLLPATTVSI